MNPDRTEEILEGMEHRIALLEEVIRANPSRHPPRPYWSSVSTHEAMYREKAASILRIVRAFEGLSLIDLHLRFLAETRDPLSTRQFRRWLKEMAVREEIRIEIRYFGNRGSKGYCHLGEKAMSDLGAAALSPAPGPGETETGR